jgi:hypothetical protein
MRWNHAIDNSIRAPTAVGRIVQMRAEGFDDLFEIRNLAHKLLAADKRGNTQVRKLLGSSNPRLRFLLEGLPDAFFVHCLIRVYQR